MPIQALRLHVSAEPPLKHQSGNGLSASSHGKRGRSNARGDSQLLQELPPRGTPLFSGAGRMLSPAVGSRSRARFGTVLLALSEPGLGQRLQLSPDQATKSKELGSQFVCAFVKLKQCYWLC